MRWRAVWSDTSTGRLRSGWRALAYLFLAGISFLLLYSIFGPFLEMVRFHGVLQYFFPLLPLPVMALIIFYPLGIYALRAFERLPAYTLGLPFTKIAIRGILLGFITGGGAILLVVLTFALTGHARIHLDWQGKSNLLVFALGVIVFLLAGAGEEVMFRGYLFQTLLRGLGWWGTLLLMSGLFAIAHWQTPHFTPLALVNIYLAGLMLGLCYLRTGSLWLPIGVHAGWNFAQQLFHLPISGIAPPETTLLKADLFGPTWLNGGTYGLEGGIGACAVLLIIIATLVLSRKGLPFASRWWEWRDLRTTPAIPLTWDFTLDARHYQWKLAGNDHTES